MTNLEKINEVIEEYETEIPAMPFNCIVSRVRRGVSLKTSCVDIVGCAECKKDNINWLLSEYEPQELKNGDGLKPGQLIEVYKKGYWEEEEFLFYANGRFWVLYDSPDMAVGWTRARLPKKVDDEE